jgi:hypothetical protein
MTFPRYPERIWAAAFGLAWAADLLFWNSTPGVSLTLWTALALAGLFLCALWEGKRPSWPSYLLGLLTLGLAVTNTLRAEPFSRVFTSLLTLGCLALLAATLTTGNWLFYRLGDYVLTAFNLLSAALIRGAQNRAAPPTELEGQAAPKQSNRFWQNARRTLPYLRGILFALPVLGVLGGLLASADPVFGERVRALLGFFDLTHLPEYLFRLFYILVFAYIFGGLFLNAVLPTRAEKRPDPQEAWKSRFLGSTEAFIILGAVVAMFGFFLILQFQYLFGGQANITETGYTYSDYARRGFFELVWVAVLSIALYLGLGTLTNRTNPASQRAFSLLSILLLALVLLILVSALQRMLLYEAAYGFTRLRTYTHIFIFWLMFLLLAAIVLEAVHRPGHYGLALLIFTLGFGLTFTLLNLDGMITSLNIQRARAGSELDIAHLTGLSADAVPILAQAYSNSAETQEVRSRSGAALACFQQQLDRRGPSKDWRAYNLSDYNAARILQGLDLSSFIAKSESGTEIKLNLETINCSADSD